MSETWPTNAATAALRREQERLPADHRETIARLAGLRREFDAFRQHVAANLAALNELAAEILGGYPDTAVPVGALRAMTWGLGQEFRGERRPDGWDPDAEYARLAGETEADKPGPVHEEEAGR